MKFLIEAIVVGICTVIVGSAVGFIFGALFSSNLPKICKKWNVNHIMEFSLFFTGFILHLLFEYFGFNKWYCKHGYACK